MKAFQFSLDNESLTIEQGVFQALNAAKDATPEEVKDIGDKLVVFIELVLAEAFGV